MSLRSHTLRWSALLTLGLGIVLWGWHVRAEGNIGETLQAELARLQPDDAIGVIVRFAPAADLTPLQGMAPAQRRAALPQLLRDHAQSAQAPLRAYLESLGATQLRTLWISNALAAVVPAGSVDAIAARAEVKRVDYDATVKLPRPVNGRR